MGDSRRKQNGEFDFDKLPEGVYFFSGQEGFVKVNVDKDGVQSWDLQNWFDSLDPDTDEAQHEKIIQDIKKRLNNDTGIINPSKGLAKKNFLNPFKRIKWTPKTYLKIRNIWLAANPTKKYLNKVHQAYK